jgi:HEAT repeat protein
MRTATWWCLVALALTVLHSAAAEELKFFQAAPGKDFEWVTPDDAGVKVLIRYLQKEQEPVVLIATLDSLARMGARAKPALPAIVETLKRSEGQVRIEAARTLLDLGSETELAFRTLKEALQAKDPATRAHAAEAIGKVPNPPFEVSSCWGPGPRPRIAYPEFGKRAVPALLELLCDRTIEVRRSAVNSLGRIRAHPETVVPALIVVLKDREPAVRLTAARALSNFGATARSAVPALVSALEDQDKEVCLQAADALRQVEMNAFVQSALPVLIKTLRDQEYDQRSKAARILEVLGPRGVAAVPALCDLLEDKDSYVRRAAARSLYIGPGAKAAVPALTRALRDAHRGTREMAALALGRIGPEAAPAVPALMELLKDEDANVQCRAAQGLGGIGPKARAAIPILLRVLESKDQFASASAAFALGDIGANAERVVPALIRTLQHEGMSARVAAAAGLGKYGEQAKAAIPALIDVLKRDDCWLVLERASDALKGLGPPAVETATTALIEALKDQSKKVRRTTAFSLGMVDAEGKSVPDLIRVLQEDAEAGYAAARALGAMGPRAKSAVPALVKALENKSIHREAAEALQKIDPEAAKKAGVQ